MSTHAAFQVREAFRPAPDDDGNETNPDAVHGAVIGLPPEARAYDVAKELAKGDGVIVTADPHEQGALRSLTWLEEVDVPEDRQPAPDTPEGLSGVALREHLDRMRKGDLASLAADRRVIVPPNATKGQLVDALVSLDPPHANEQPDPEDVTPPATDERPITDTAPQEG